MCVYMYVCVYIYIYIYTYMYACNIHLVDHDWIHSGVIIGGLIDFCGDCIETKVAGRNTSAHSPGC